MEYIALEECSDIPELAARRSDAMSGIRLRLADSTTPGAEVYAGGDAVWLAREAWKVTGVDVSAIALERAAATATAAAVTVDWICADIAGIEPSRGDDLVSVLWPALCRSAGEPAIQALLRATAPRRDAAGRRPRAARSRMDPRRRL